MKSSNIWDSSEFMVKIKSIGKILKDSIWDTATSVGLYPNISHKKVFEALK